MSGAIGVTAGAGLTLGGTFMTWLRSGARGRSSYTIFDLVDRLGFANGGVVSWSLRLWPLVPLLLVALAVSAWAVATSHLRWGVAVAMGSVVAVWVGGTAVAILRAPDAGLFRVGHGPTVTLVGVVVVAAGILTLRTPGSAASGAS